MDSREKMPDSKEQELVSIKKFEKLYQEAKKIVENMSTDYILLYDADKIQAFLTAASNFIKEKTNNPAEVVNSKYEQIYISILNNIAIIEKFTDKKIVEEALRVAKKGKLSYQAAPEMNPKAFLREYLFSIIDTAYGFFKDQQKTIDSVVHSLRKNEDSKSVIDSVLTEYLHIIQSFFTEKYNSAMQWVRSADDLADNYYFKTKDLFQQEAQAKQCKDKLNAPRTINGSNIPGISNNFVTVTKEAQGWRVNVYVKGILDFKNRKAQAEEPTKQAVALPGCNSAAFPCSFWETSRRHGEALIQELKQAFANPKKIQPPGC